MRTVCVIQHTEAEYLGLMEDHFEGRNIRFSYKRPFTPGATIPANPEDYDGLMLLGGGPYGLVSGHLLPSFMPELRLTKAFLDAGLPVVGFGLGALILCTAAGGGVEEAPLRFDIVDAEITVSGQNLLGLPERVPFALYLRDAPALPDGASVLARDGSGAPLAFGIGKNSLGFLNHPGIKRGMIEDLIMEFTDTPAHTAEALLALGEVQAEIAEHLGSLMVGLIRHTGWM